MSDNETAYREPFMASIFTQLPQNHPDIHPSNAPALALQPCFLYLEPPAPPLYRVPPFPPKFNGCRLFSIQMSPLNKTDQKVSSCVGVFPINTLSRNDQTRAFTQFYIYPVVFVAFIWRGLWRGFLKTRASAFPLYLYLYLFYFKKSNKNKGIATNKEGESILKVISQTARVLFFKAALLAFLWKVWRGFSPRFLKTRADIYLLKQRVNLFVVWRGFILLTTLISQKNACFSLIHDTFSAEIGGFHDKSWFFWSLERFRPFYWFTSGLFMTSGAGFVAGFSRWSQVFSIWREI